MTQNRWKLIKTGSTFDTYFTATDDNIRNNEATEVNKNPKKDFQKFFKFSIAAYEVKHSPQLILMSVQQIAELGQTGFLGDNKRW